MRPAISHRHKLFFGCIMAVASICNETGALPFAPTVSHSQPQRPTPDNDLSDQDGVSFAGQFGLQAAQAALTLGGDARLRQLRTFATSDVATRSVQRQIARELHAWLSHEPTLTPEENLALTQALAPLNEHELARKHLKRLMVLTEAPKSSTPPPTNNGQLDTDSATQRLTLAAKTAALALAKSEHPDALRELGQWLRRPNAEAEFAASALTIAPPRDLSALLDASGPVTPLLLRALQALHNPRAEPFLRQVIKRATAAVQAEAALALLALNVDETQELAAHWLASKEIATELLWASTHILFHYQRPERKAALVRLIGTSPVLALDVASRYTDPELLLLGDHLSQLPSHTERKNGLEYLSRLEQAAVPLLTRVLETTPELAPTAAALLARLSTEEASHALRTVVRTASQSKTNSVATIALLGLAASAARGNAEPAATRILFENHLGKASGAQLQAAKLGLAALDVSWAQKWLNSAVPEDMAIAARVVGLHGTQFRRRVLARLSEFISNPLDPKALALSAAVSAMEPRDTLPAGLLRVWAQSSLPVAYPAIWQLCTRLPVTPADPLNRWLANSDPEVRAAVYLGLGTNPEPGHTARLLAALHQETDPWVRRTLVVALSNRALIPPVRRALQRERDYNPDPTVQHLLRNPVQSRSREFWFADSNSSPANTREQDRTQGRDVQWFTLTSVTHPPLSISVSQSTPAFVFLPDDRDFDVNEFHVHTYPASQPTQASN